jgi:integrase
MLRPISSQRNVSITPIHSRRIADAAAQRGLPAKVVQDLLGHSSITVTLDTYGHLFPRR